VWAATSIVLGIVVGASIAVGPVAMCEFEPCDHSTLLALGLLAVSLGVMLGALFSWQIWRAVRAPG
jgi:hypothetical protein